MALVSSTIASGRHKASEPRSMTPSRQERPSGAATRAHGPLPAAAAIKAAVDDDVRLDAARDTLDRRHALLGCLELGLAYGHGSTIAELQRTLALCARVRRLCGHEVMLADGGATDRGSCYGRGRKDVAPPAFEPAGFLAGFDGPAFIDEVQRAPELILAIKQVVDGEQKPEQFGIDAILSTQRARAKRRATAAAPGC